VADKKTDPSGQDERRPAVDRPVLLMTTWNDGEAAMIRQILENYGIPTQVVSDVPHTVLPISVDGLGEVRILVPADRKREAHALLAEHRREGLKIVDGGKAPPGTDDDKDGSDS
jgi:hypothetical protein